MAGQWHDIPIDDNVISIARWAVDEYNKEQSARLEFRGVWSASEQIVEGTRYSIALAAAGEGEIRKYGAVVLVLPTKVKVLEKFSPLYDDA